MKEIETDRQMNWKLPSVFTIEEYLHGPLFIFTFGLVHLGITCA
jgi:hypothetical protein